MSAGRLRKIQRLNGFSCGSLSFTYLGFLIFKGSVKAEIIQHISDRIIARFSSWKGFFLSMEGKVLMVKMVIQSMITHSIFIYSWPVSLLKSIERASNNFIWSGDITFRKRVVVAWKHTCFLLANGSLGFRLLTALNASSNLNFCWDLLNSKEEWACILKARIIRSFSLIKHHIFSSF